MRDERKTKRQLIEELQQLRRQAGAGEAKASAPPPFDLTQADSSRLSQRVRGLDCLNEIGRKIDEAPPLAEFLSWLAGRIPSAMPQADVCIAAVEFEGQVYGNAEARRLPRQMAGALRAGGEVVGRIYVAYTEDRDFADVESALLGDIVRRVSGYIENRRLVEQAQAHAAELTVLNELSRTLTSRLSVRQVLEETYRGISRLLDTRNFYIGLYDPLKDEIHFLLNVTDEEIDLPPSMSADRGIAGYIVRHRTSVLIPEDVGGWLEQHGVEAVGGELPLCWLGVPLLVGEQVLGVMAVQSALTPRAYDEHDRDLLLAFANQTAIAIQNARLFEQAQDHLAELAVLNELSQVLTATLDLNEVLDQAYAGVSRLLDTTNFYVALYRPATDEVTFALDVAEGQVRRDTSTRRAGTGLTEYIIRNRQPVLIEDNLSARLAEMGVEVIGRPALSWLGVPLMVGGEVVGVMAVQSYTATHAYDEQDRELLTAVAGQVAIAIQNARLYQEAQAHAGELGVLNELSRTLTARLDVTQVVEETYRGLSRLMDTTNFYIGIYDPQRQQVTFPINVSESVIDREITTMPSDQGMTGYILRNRTSVLIEDDVVGWAERHGVALVGDVPRCWLGVPLMIGEQVIGVMALQNFHAPRIYGEHERELLVAFASQAAIAIQNARLFEDRERRIEQLGILIEMGRALSSAVELDDLLRVVDQQVSRVFDTTNFFISLYEEEYDEWLLAFIRERGQPDPRQGGRYKMGAGLTSHVIRTRQPVFIRSLEENITFHETHGIPSIGDRAKSWMGVPLIAADRIVGVMAVQSYDQEYLYDQEDLDLFSTIAANAAVAIYNARLFRGVQERIADLSVLNEVSQAILEAVMEEEVLEAVYRQAGRVMDTANFYVALYDEAQQTFSFPYFVERGQRIPGPEPLPLTGGGLTSYILRHRQPLLLMENVAAQMEERQIHRRGEIPQSYLGVPMIAGGNLVGAIAVQSYEQERAYTPRHLDLLTNIATQAAIAIQRSRLFRERERRIAEMAIVNEIGQAVSSPLGLDELLAVVHQQINTLFDARNFYVALYYEDADEWESPFHLEHGVPQPVIRRKVTAGLTGYIIRSRQPVLFRSPEDTIAFEKQAGVRTIGERAKSWMGVPLIAADRVVGVMAIQSYEQAGLYGPDDLALFSTIAAQVAVAVARARLYDQEQRAREQLAARVSELDCLSDLGRRIGEAPPMAEFLSWVTERLPRAMRQPDVCVAAIELGGRVYGQAEALTLPAQTVGSLRIGDELVGRLVVAYREEHAFSDAESALLGEVVRRVSGYLENQQLIERSRRRSAELETLYQSALQLAAQRDTAEVIRLVVEQAVALLGAEAGGLYLYDAEKGELVFSVATGYFTEFIGKRLQPGEGLAGRVFVSGQAEVIEDYQRWDGRATAYEGEQRLTSLLAVPLIGWQGAIGVLDITGGARKRTFDVEDVRLAGLFAAQATSALETTRLLEDTRAALAETETLYNASRRLAAAGDLQEIVAAVVEGIPVPAANRAVFWEIERDAAGQPVAFVSVANWYSGTGTPPLPLGVRFSLEQFPATKLVLSPEPVFMDDLEVDERMDPITRMVFRQQNARAIAVLPLRVGERQIGSLMLVAEEPHHFSARETRPYISLSQQMAVALENRRLLQQVQAALVETERRARRERVLREMTAVVRGAVAPDVIARAAVRELGTALGRPVFVRLGSAGELARPPERSAGGDGATQEGGEEHA